MVSEQYLVFSVLRITSAWLIAGLTVMLTGCAALNQGAGMLGDGNVSIHVLRSQTREAQRIIAEMRAEIAASRQTLAASQTARARVEGQLREAQRRYEEARQVVVLQREELARLRDEREEVLRASRDLRRYMAGLQRQITALVGARGSGPHAPTPSPVDTQPDVRTSRNGARGAALPVRTTTGGGDGALDMLATGVHPRNGAEPDGGIAGVVVVQPGDTLSKLAIRYGVSYPAMRSLNGLDANPDLIFVGQRLLLPK